MPPRKRPVASTSLLASGPDGCQRRLTIEIGRPYAVGEEEAACPVTIAGLRDKIPDNRGVDTFHALALSVVRLLLQDFVAKGGRITHLDGTELDLPSHFGLR